MHTFLFSFAGNIALGNGVLDSLHIISTLFRLKQQHRKVDYECLGGFFGCSVNDIFSIRNMKVRETGEDPTTLCINHIGKNDGGCIQLELVGYDDGDKLWSLVC